MVDSDFFAQLCVPTIYIHMVDSDIFAQLCVPTIYIHMVDSDFLPSHVFLPYTFTWWIVTFYPVMCSYHIHSHGG